MVVGKIGMRLNKCATMFMTPLMFTDILIFKSINREKKILQ